MAKVRRPYDELTYRAKNRIIRWSHESRFRTALGLVDPRPDERILDIGAGDGHLLRLCREACPSAHYAALEPYKAPTELAAGDPIRWFKTPDGLAEVGPFDKIACFEVLEHLSEGSIESILGMVHTHLAATGRFLVSVPIEIGPPVAVKHLVNFLAGKRRLNVSLPNIVWSVLGLTDRIPRDGDLIGHMGFNHGKLLRHITSAGRMILVRVVTSPFSALPTWANSQVFWIFVRGEQT